MTEIVDLFEFLVMCHELFLVLMAMVAECLLRMPVIVFFAVLRDAYDGCVDYIYTSSWTQSVVIVGTYKWVLFHSCYLAESGIALSVSCFFWRSTTLFDWLWSLD